MQQGVFGGNGMKDVIEDVFNYLPFEDFFAARQVCLVWWKASFKNQKHWYEWLLRYGNANKNVRVHDYDRFPACDEVCTRGTHLVWTKQVQTLKTVTLPTQVFMYATRKRNKRAQRDLENNTAAINNYERMIASLRSAQNTYVQKAVQAEKDKNDAENMRNQRKRRKIRINISK